MTLRFLPETRGPKVAYLFPGQGSHQVGMGKELYESSPAARSVFQQVDMALGRPLSGLLFDDDTDLPQVGCDDLQSGPERVGVLRPMPLSDDLGAHLSVQSLKQFGGGSPER